jgi:hypothetical protein
MREDEMRHKKIFGVLIVFSLFSIGILIMAPIAMSAESPAAKSKNWEFNLAPFYIWGVAIDGDVTSGTNTVPVEVQFSDITDNLEAAFILHFEGMHKSNWGFLIDVNYLDLSGGVNLPGPFNVPGNVDFDATIAEFSALYRMANGDHSYDLIAGLRYTKLENKLTLNAGPTLVDASEDWTDPLIGARWIWGFADQWTLIARGDIGGFGIGSDIALQGLALVDWQPFKYVSFLAGYRAIYQDYEDGSGSDRFNYDATMHGPVLGVNFRW